MNRFRYKLYELYARFHLKFICPKCPRERRLLRDIKNKGECLWYASWEKGVYNTRTFQTYMLFKKLGIDKDIFLK